MALGCVLLLAGSCAGDGASDEPTSNVAPTSVTTTAVVTTQTVAQAPPPTTTLTSTSAPPTDSVPPDTEPPRIAVTSPSNGEVFTTPEVRFAGSTEPGAAVVAWDRWPADVEPNGAWELVLVLDPGTNVARFTATDAAGNTSVAEVVVTFDPPAPTTSVPRPPATIVITFSPKAVPDETVEGDCIGHSMMTHRDDAYRCRTGNEIHDPCFDTGDHVICKADPITGDTGFIVDLASPLPTDAPPAGVHPWIIELSDGALCWAVGGATGTVDGVRLEYACADGSWVLRDLQRGEVWTGHRVVMGNAGLEVVTDDGFVPIRRLWL